jgi:hypothetical protein
MLDTTRINHKLKKITPMDIKTTGQPVTKFNTVIEKRRGDVQAAFYTRGIKQCLETICKIVGKDVRDYHIDQFAFIVESTSSAGIPLIFPMKMEAMLRGVNGDDEVDGWYAALQKYATYKAYDFSVEKLLEEKRGIVWVDGEFKTDLPI